MNVFDILGPVMIGPSSSHTAGAARIGRITRTLLGAPAVKADILLHGSFAKTYKGHGTDKALIAGIMGMATDDVRIRQAPELAKEAGLEVHISTGDIDGAHPNTAGFSSGFQYRRRKYPGNGSQWYGSFPYRTVYDSDRPSQRCSRHHCRCYRSHGRRRHQHLQFPSFQTEKRRRGGYDH